MHEEDHRHCPIGILYMRYETSSKNLASLYQLIINILNICNNFYKKCVTYLHIRGDMYLKPQMYFTILDPIYTFF